MAKKAAGPLLPLMCVRGEMQGAEALSDDEIKKVIGQLEFVRQDHIKKGFAEDGNAALFAHAEATAEALDLRAAKEKANAKLQRVKNKQNALDVGRLGGYSQGIEAIIASTNKRLLGGRNSVNTIKTALEGQWLAGMVGELRREKLLQYVQPRWLGVGRGLMDDKIAIELYELRDGGTPGKSGSPEAAKIAKIINKYQELARLYQNQHGAFIGKLDGFIARQSHDMFRVAAAGKEAWISFIKPLLDDRTFTNLKLTPLTAENDINDFLGGIYDEIKTGRYFAASSSEASLARNKGPANLARRVSAQRVLHFKGAGEWFKYNKAFGAASVMDAVAMGFRHAARNAALLQRFGPNPRAGFNHLLNTERQRAITDPKLSEAENKRLGRDDKTWSHRMMDVADGTSDVPSSIGGAAVGTWVREVENMAKLGGALFASVPDVATAASELQFQGETFLGAIGKQFSNMLAQIADDGERRTAAELVGVGVESVIREVVSRIAGSDAQSRTLGKLTGAFFKLNLLEPWTEAGERALASIMSRNLALARNTAFDRLNPRMQEVLGLYGIERADWDLIRKHAITKIAGKEYIDPSGLRGIAELKPKDAALLETKLRGYFTDRTSVGVLKGGIREKAYATRGLKAGTVEGEAMRFMMQFKQYGISFAQKVLGRYGQEDRFWSIPGALWRMPANDKFQLAQLMVSLTALGYLGEMARNLAQGKTPPDPTKLDTMMRAMSTSGMGGIYSDFIFMHADRFGGGGDVALSPSAKLPLDVWGLYLKSRDWAMSGGKTDAPDTEAWSLLKSNTPFINLFYTRAALDYLILYHMQEALAPGSVRRMERRVKEDTGQDFFYSPAEAVQ